MTQAPATPSLVERVKEASYGAAQSYLNSTPWRGALRGDAFLAGVAWVISDPGFAALEAQQARIAELEAELADVAIPSPYCEICGSCGSEGCGCEHKCKYAHSHPDVVRDMDALQALADRYEKALRFYANAVVASQHPDRLGACDDGWAARQALSSQGRHEGGEVGLPELPGVNAVPLPASPDGPRSAGWFTMDHDPRSGRKFIALYNDGSGAAMFWRHPDGVIDQNGDEGGWPLKGYDRWAYLPDDLEFWCEICPEDPMTLHITSPDNTNPKAGAPEHG